MAKRKYVLKTRAKVMIMLLLIGYFLFKFIDQEFTIQGQMERIDSLKQQIAMVKDENEEIQRQIEYTKTKEYVEKMARERLGWIKEDEIILIPKN